MCYIVEYGVGMRRTNAAEWDERQELSCGTCPFSGRQLTRRRGRAPSSWDSPELNIELVVAKDRRHACWKMCLFAAKNDGEGTFLFLLFSVFCMQENFYASLILFPRKRYNPNNRKEKTKNKLSSLYLEFFLVVPVFAQGPDCHLIGSS